MLSSEIDKKKSGIRDELFFGPNILSGDTIHLLVPAKAKSVDLLIPEKGKRRLPLNQVQEGLFELITDELSIGDKYQYVIDNEMIVPDPATRYQPDGVHGASQITDPNSFKWTDTNWRGKPWHEVIIYELHIGTFTEAGNFQSVINKLDHLIELGITAIELMPVAEFPGNRNWGYDGTLLFSPSHTYGKPDDLKTLINACHQKGIMIFLDVVYNHFGPEGNYLHNYGKYFFSDKYKTPWGQAINFDGNNSELVRKFFIDNALYWLKEFHFDGLRMDAVHAIYDESEKHIIHEISHNISSLKENGRHIHIVLENDDNIASFLSRNSKNEPVYISAQWNDDFHHIFHVLMTKENEGYYRDYAFPDNDHALMTKLGRCLTEGFIYQGEVSPVHDNKKRGEPSRNLPPPAFVSFLQNHDQIGNRAFGERIEKLANLDKFKTLLSVFLLHPQIPLLFMGEEWAASTPFYYFANLGDDLAPLVTKGRREEFKQFASFNDSEKLESIPDPSAMETFINSKLNWQEIKNTSHLFWLQYYQSLIKIRKNVVIPLIEQIVPGQASYTLPGEKCLEIKWKLANHKELILLLNLSDKEQKSDFNYSTELKPFFEKPEKSFNLICRGKLPANCTIWLLR